MVRRLVLCKAKNFAIHTQILALQSTIKNNMNICWRTVPPDFRQCEGLGVDSRKQTDAVLAYCKAKLTQKICPNGAIARKSGSPLHPSSGTFI